MNVARAVLFNTYRKFSYLASLEAKGSPPNTMTIFLYHLGESIANLFHYIDFVSWGVGGSPIGSHMVGPKELTRMKSQINLQQTGICIQPPTLDMIRTRVQCIKKSNVQFSVHT